MDAVALMDRTDTKYLLTMDDALSVLERLSGHYQALTIGPKRVFPYRTVYFDTADKRLLNEHLRGKLNREKVRSREYVGTDSRFFELKLKTNKGRTVKSRMKKVAGMEAIQPEEATFLSSVSDIDATELSPVLEVNFERITLASTVTNERITFDLGLSFSAVEDKSSLGGLVVVEVKRDSKGTLRSPAMEALKDLSVRPISLSKYCIGMILLNQTPRYNRYKPKLLTLNKISTNGTIW